MPPQTYCSRSRSAIAATGIAGDGMVEAFRGPEDEKGSEGNVSRKAS
jgi:hypothetical protein